MALAPKKETSFSMSQQNGYWKAGWSG